MAFDRRETVLLVVGDFLLLAVSLWIALLLRNWTIPRLGYFESNLIPFLPIFLLSLVIFYIAGLYEKQTRPIRRVMGTRILAAQAATVALAAILFFVLPLSIAPKTILVLYLAVSVVLESVWRFYRMTREMQIEKRTPAILIGSGAPADELYDEVQGNDRYFIRFVGRAITIEDIPPELRGVLVRDVASLYEEIFDRVLLEHLDTTKLLESLAERHELYDGSKRFFDIVLALVGIILAVPFVVVAAITLSFSGGMPFIRHERIGKNGRIFRILKMRTMLFNDNGDPNLQKKNRVTSVGRFLRKTRIDELPQLWNVLVGDLSFIGPRPELPIIAAVYEKEIPQYQIRHLIVPGLSGWAQIHDYDAPRGGADIPRTYRKLSFDLYYLKHRSFGLDLAITVKTVRALLAFSGT